MSNIKNPPTGKKQFTKRKKLILKRPKTNKTLLVRVDEKTEIYVDPNFDITEQINIFKDRRSEAEKYNLNPYKNDKSHKTTT
jgi:hypothetical protein